MTTDSPAASESFDALNPTVPPLNRPMTPGIVEGERRIITILFCDVVSSTALAGQLDPEEWAEIMNEAFQYMIAPIQEYEGMVARLMGDAILAFFGAPQAHEDDPQRAVLAGLGIVNGMRPFIKQFYEEYGLDFNVRVGINTGPVVVGEIGSKKLQEYTAMGDAINLAARMEQTALPGTVQISEDTYRHVAPLFDVWELGAIEVKGKEEPVQAYRVLGVDPQPGRMRGIEGLETQLIGRSREMARLSESLTGLAAGKSRIVFLLGEAGLGKSRLIAELRREWRARLAEIYGQTPPIWSGWTEFVAVSYGASRPYDMLKRQLRQYCAIRETDPPVVVHERLHSLVGLYPETLQKRLHRFFGFLLGDTLPEDGPLPEGEAFKRELRALLSEAASFQSDQGPIIYVMDDLHWADPASIDALRGLLSLVTTRPILFLLALRPDWASPGWQLFINSQLDFPEQCVSIFLEPLSSEDSRALIAELLGGDIVPPRLVEAIQQKAEGNPLFIEEVARALYNDRVVVRTDDGTVWQSGVNESEVLKLISLPGNVQALMTARIDRLSPDVRRTLQLASVIGRTFPQRVLEQLVDPGVNVADQLQTLVGADLIRPTGSTEGEYVFLHALARDAAYETILIRQRRRYHRRVAEVIEATYPDRLEEEAPRLAYHFAEARDWARAIHYYSIAGEAAARIYAHPEAIEHFTRAIELALAAPDAVDEESLIQLFMRRGRVYELDGLYDEALNNYRTLEELGQSRGNAALELAGVAPQAIIYAIPNYHMDANRGAERANRTLALAGPLGRADAQARAYWSLLLLNLNATGDLGQAIDFGERALALANENNLTEIKAYVLNDIGRAYGLAGRMRDALAAFAEARILWKELGNLHMLTDALSISAQGTLVNGDPLQAAALAREGLAIAHRISNRWGEASSSFSLGCALLEMGRLDEAFDVLRQSVEAAQEIQFQGPGAIIPVVLAWEFGELGAPNYHQEELASWLSKAPVSEDSEVLGHLWEAIKLHFSGHSDRALMWVSGEHQNEQVMPGNDLLFTSLITPAILLANEHYEETLVFVEKQLNLMRALQFSPYVADHLRYQALAQRGLGDDDSARASLSQALAAARAHANHRSLWQILVDLVSLETDPATRSDYRRQAVDEVNFVASNLGDLALRSTFLEQPAVRELLAGDTA